MSQCLISQLHEWRILSLQIWHSFFPRRFWTSCFKWRIISSHSSTKDTDIYDDIPTRRSTRRCWSSSISHWIYSIQRKWRHISNDHHRVDKRSTPIKDFPRKSVLGAGCNWGRLTDTSYRIPSSRVIGWTGEILEMESQSPRSSQSLDDPCEKLLKRNTGVTEDRPSISWSSNVDERYMPTEDVRGVLSNTKTNALKLNTRRQVDESSVVDISRDRRDIIHDQDG